VNNSVSERQPTSFERAQAAARKRLLAPLIGIASGALFGALIGGVAGRIAMRLVFLIDRDTEAAQTDFGTIGEFTLGGSLTLLMLSAIAGAIGGAIYIGLRRWLPWSGVARGVFFGMMMAFGPGVIFLGEIDLQIAEPAVPIYFMFIALMVAYGVGVALLTDRLHAEPAIAPGARTRQLTMAAQALLSVAIVAVAVVTTVGVYEDGGSCLSADQEGGCAVQAPE